MAYHYFAVNDREFAHILVGLRLLEKTPNVDPAQFPQLEGIEAMNAEEIDNLAEKLNWSMESNISSDAGTTPDEVSKEAELAKFLYDIADELPPDSLVAYNADAVTTAKTLITDLNKRVKARS